jgi:glycosyltransferase involved in cell wall biosynthesis
MTARYLKDYGIEAVLFDPWIHPRDFAFDLVHLFAANIGTYHFARELRQRKVPIVISPITFSSHSPRFVRNGLRLTRLVQRVGAGLWTDYGIMADMCNWAAAVLPNTNAEADLVVRGLASDPSKVQVVPNGVEDRFLESNPELFRKKFGLMNFVLNVGHIGYRRKNVLALIKALGSINHPSVIVGRVASNAYANACLQEARKHPHIHVIEGIDHDSELLASAYACCDVFALPSLFETPGIAALEAGLTGAKIVITPYGGTREYFGEHAHYVEPDSVHSIRSGISTALGEQKSTVLQSTIKERFLWQKVAEATSSVYRRVLQGT